jgi:uncharacterized membrane protein YjjP (DUF1212 family)
MNYNLLMDLAIDLGYELAMSGAETFRVEESVTRLLTAYGVDSDVFAIPNYIMITLRDKTGTPITRMRRIGYHGNDLDSVERYSNLSRKICSETPDAQIALQWIHQADLSRLKYSTVVNLIGSFLGACGFSAFFGSNLIDSICGGICGVLVGLVLHILNNFKVNQFFSTVASAFIMSVAACVMNAMHIVQNTDTVIIGPLMILVPGLLFTNAMRDIIFGDTNSGVNRIVQVLLIAVAIALGTGAGWALCDHYFTLENALAALPHSYIVQCVVSFIGCLGFTILFNIHGPGGLLCALGGLVVWAVYCVTIHFTGNDLLANFTAAVTSAAYAETMARVRKYPAISYLVVSIFPLLPGAGIYYTISAFVRGDMGAFANTGSHTIAIAGVLAVGILIVSTTVRSWTEWRKRKKASV